MPCSSKAWYGLKSTQDKGWSESERESVEKKMSRKADGFASGETDKFYFVAEHSISEVYTQMLWKEGRWEFG